MIEKNNNSLRKINDSFSEQLHESKIKNEFLVKKYEEETVLLKEKLEYYRQSLNKLYGQIQFQTTSDIGSK